MGLFSALSFGAPWVLAALAALPVLWWLLKVTPPQPRRIAFPPIRLLLGLKDEEQTPAHTPWWLLLLRLMAAGLLILALADPLLGRVVKILGDGPLVLVVDNGWTAAKHWDQRQTLISDLLRAAGDRPVAIVPTATSGPVTLMDAGAAEKSARILRDAPQCCSAISTAPHPLCPLLARFRPAGAKVCTARASRSAPRTSMRAMLRAARLTPVGSGVDGVQFPMQA